jgi:NAD(P)-dependent dehydrogenase (short-subunit alcohol dehydrogenase family)
MSTSHIVIVGGSSGIGMASARRFLAAGHHVTIAGRDEAKLAKAKTALGKDVHITAFDAADTAAIRKAFTAIGKFDHLVLTLGSNKGLGPFTSIDPEEVKAGFAEKAFTHFACAQAALPHLSQQGSITFVSAVTAHAAMPGTAGIGAVNAAIASLVPTLAMELQPLRVNAVSPGVIDSPWWDFLPPEQKAGAFAEYAGKSLAGRVGKPDDIAQVIESLVSNSFLTGQTIVCDGGLRLAA